MSITTVKATFDGQEYTLTFNETTRKYETVIVPGKTSHNEEGGYFNTEITATNDKGVSTTTDGTNIPGLRLTVQEEVPPTIQLLSPAEGILTTNVLTFVVEAFDEENGSGIDPSSLSMLIDGVEGDISTQATEKGYQFTYTPRNELSEGNHSLTASIQDNDGNQASLSSVYIVDTVPPELTVHEYRQIVDDESITVEGVTKDVTTSPVTLLVGGEEAAIDEHGQFSHTVPLRVGENYITVTATDKAGLSSSFRLYVIRLITDRSQADIEELLTILSKEDQTEEELIQLAQTSYKGAYNETDMNRVTTAAEFLSDSLYTRGYVNPYVPVNPGPGRDYWVKEDKPTLEQSKGYVSNVKRIRETFPFVPDLPEAPSDMQSFTFQEANNLEKIFVQVESMFQWMDKSYLMAGEAMCGEF